MGRRLCCPICGELLRGKRFVTCGAAGCARAWHTICDRARTRALKAEAARLAADAQRKRRVRARRRTALTEADAVVAARLRLALGDADRVMQRKNDGT